MGFKIQVTGIREFKQALTKTTRGTEDILIETIEWAVLVLAKEITNLASGRLVKVRSNRYRGSIRTVVDRRRLEGVVGTKVVYARQIEFGGTIKAKAGGWLTVPLPAAKTRGGDVRGSARDFKGTFFIKSKKGNLILMGRPTPGSRRIVPLFVLKRRVKQKPKRVFQTAQKNKADEIGPELERRMSLFLGTVFKGAR